jgi:hypothetical protein
VDQTTYYYNGFFYFLYFSLKRRIEPWDLVLYSIFFNFFFNIHYGGVTKRTQHYIGVLISKKFNHNKDSIIRRCMILDSKIYFFLSTRGGGPNHIPLQWFFFFFFFFFQLKRGIGSGGLNQST